MSDMRVVRHCSPTLAGMKTGSLFPCGDSLLERDIRRINRLLVPKGLRMVPLYGKRNTLVYLYRPARLEADLARPEARRILSSAGYRIGGEGMMVTQLARRFAQGGGFPHEVGLFLGYPPEDVEAFITHRRPALCVGCWKVYGNRERAEATFLKFKKCAHVYCRLAERGIPVQRLAVKEKEHETCSRVLERNG